VTSAFSKPSCAESRSRRAARSSSRASGGAAGRSPPRSSQRSASLRAGSRPEGFHGRLVAGGAACFHDFPEAATGQQVPAAAPAPLSRALLPVRRPARFQYDEICRIAGPLKPRWVISICSRNEWPPKRAFTSAATPARSPPLAAGGPRRRSAEPAPGTRVRPSGRTAAPGGSPGRLRRVWDREAAGATTRAVDCRFLARFDGEKRGFPRACSHCN